MAGRTLSPKNIIRVLDEAPRRVNGRVDYWVGYAVRQGLFRALCVDPDKADMEWQELFRTGFIRDERFGGIVTCWNDTSFPWEDRQAKLEMVKAMGDPLAETDTSRPQEQQESTRVYLGHPGRPAVPR